MIKPVNVFSGRTPKESESIQDCQDEFKITENCIAIADGSTQSLYSGLWAGLLVDYYCQYPAVNKDNWEHWLKPVQEEWLSGANKKIKIAKEENKPSWIDNQNRLNRIEAATATFIGVNFKENNINITIVGDSCIFLCKKNKIIKSFPLNNSNEFNDRPQYLASYPKDNKFQPTFHSWQFEKDKIKDLYMIFATDAMAEWILKNKEHNKNILPQLLNISSEKDFDEFVSDARVSKEVPMKNDDATLVIVRFADWEVVQVEPTETSENFFLGEKKENGNKLTAPPNAEESSRLNQKLKKENNYLRIGISLCSLFILVFLFKEMQVKPVFPTQKKTVPVQDKPPTIVNFPQLPQSPKETDSTEISAGTIVYSKDDRDIPQLINPLKKKVKALIIFKEKNWIKFEIVLYAHQTLLDSCRECSANEIKLKASMNIRTSPSVELKVENIFGILKNATRFEKQLYPGNAEWNKFKFVGYIKTAEQ